MAGIEVIATGKIDDPKFKLLLQDPEFMKGATVIVVRDKEKPLPIGLLLEISSMEDVHLVFMNDLHKVAIPIFSDLNLDKIDLSKFLDSVERENTFTLKSIELLTKRVVLFEEKTKPIYLEYPKKIGQVVNKPLSKRKRFKQKILF